MFHVWELLIKLLNFLQWESMGVYDFSIVKDRRLCGINTNLRIDHKSIPTLLGFPEDSPLYFQVQVSGFTTIKPYPSTTIEQPIKGNYRKRNHSLALPHRPKVVIDDQPIEIER